MNNPAASCGYQNYAIRIIYKASPPNVFIGVQFRARLDSRLKHAGMTDFGETIHLTQQAAGNRPKRLNDSKQKGI